MQKKLGRLLRSTASRINDLADSLDPRPTLEMIRPGMTPEVRVEIAGAILGAVGVATQQLTESEAKAIMDRCAHTRLIERDMFEKAHEYARAADQRRYPLSESPRDLEEIHPTTVAALDSKAILEKAPEIASALAKHLSENSKKL